MPPTVSSHLHWSQMQVLRAAEGVREAIPCFRMKLRANQAMRLLATGTLTCTAPNARFTMNCHEMLGHFKIQKSGASVAVVGNGAEAPLAMTMDIEQLWSTNHFERCLAYHDIWQSCLDFNPIIIDAVHLIIVLNRFCIAHFEQDLFVR